VTRLQWEALPPGRVAAIEDRIGQVVKAEAATRGLMPGLAATVHAGTGRYFVKAAPADSPAASLYEREMAASRSLPPEAPAPRLLLASPDEGWLLMVFEYADGRDADLSPASPDLPGVLDILQAIGATTAWDGAPSVTLNIQGLLDKAALLLGSSPGGQPWDMYAAAVAGFDPECLAGDSLVHYDLHPGNLKVDDEGTVRALDWSFACSGGLWLDMVLLMPRLIEAGHTPAAAERLAARLPAWRSAPLGAVTALAALWTMFREYKALHGPHDARGFRAQAAQAGHSWVTYRMS
jgi:hypothetical protein